MKDRAKKIAKYLIMTHWFLPAIQLSLGALVIWLNRDVENLYLKLWAAFWAGASLGAAIMTFTHSIHRKTFLGSIPELCRKATEEQMYAAQMGALKRIMEELPGLTIIPIQIGTEPPPDKSKMN